MGYRVIKYFQKVLFYLVVTVVVALAAGAALILVYEDEIKTQIIRNLNGYINTPVDVQKIDISLFENLPYVSVVLYNTVVTESSAPMPGRLLEAEKIALKINPLQILYGDYSINGVVIENGSMSLKTFKDGLTNFRIFKETDAASGQNKGLNIQGTNLINMEVKISDMLRDYNIGFLSEDLMVDINIADSTLQMDVKGPITTEIVTVGKSSFLKNKKVELLTSIDYNKASGLITINTGNIFINDSEYRFSGSYHSNDIGNIKCSLEGVGTDVQSLVSLLPEDLAGDLAKYRSQGNVYFDVKLEGRLNKTETPGVAVHFGFKNTSVTHPKTGIKVEDAMFEGWYVSNSMTDLKNAELRVRDFSGALEGKKITGNFVINDFTDKRLEFSLEGTFDLASVGKFIDQDYFTNSSGTAEADIEFSGRLEDLKNIKTATRVKSGGQITLENAGFELKDIRYPFQGVSGVLLFNDSNVALNDIEGSLGNSHFNLNGLLVNIFSYLFLEDEPLAITATLSSDFIDLNELLSAGKTEESDKPYAFSVSPRLMLNFDCQVEKVIFRRFSGEQVRGRLRIKDQVCNFNNITFRDLGGAVAMEGVVDGREEEVSILTSFSTNNIYIDSIFYVFENFNQDFLVDRHFGGRVNSNVTAQMKFSPFLELYTETLTADLKVSVLDGELKKFEPLYDLREYVPDDDLTYLKFSDMSNDIHIENETIYLPPMEIRSNITNINIGGTHTFDQHINYNIIVPFIRGGKVDKDEAFGAIEDDGAEGPKLYLLLTGTTSEYEVKFDKRGFKKGIVSGLKKEVEELKDAFRKKSDEQKKETVLDDEYFDWEDK